MTTGVGNDANSYVISAAIVFPVTITAASNDQFEYNEVEYLIPAGVYANPTALAKAINAATLDEDFSSSPAFNTLVFVYADAGSHKLRFVSQKGRTNDALAFGTGAEHDALATIGLTDGWTIGHTQAGVAEPCPKNSAQGTPYASSVFFDGNAYVSNGARY